MMHRHDGRQLAKIRIMYRVAGTRYRYGWGRKSQSSLYIPSAAPRRRIMGWRRSRDTAQHNCSRMCGCAAHTPPVDPRSLGSGG